VSPPDRAPSPAGQRFALLDALRGAAALAVMGIHLGYHSGAEARPWGGFTAHLNVGVTLFFLLSGFLLYLPWARAASGIATRPSLSVYARRRFLRIVPAYWVALTVLGLLGSAPRVMTSDWWIYYGLLQSYRANWFWGGIGPTWSLSVEAAFYAVLPLIGAAVLALGRNPSSAARRLGEPLFLAALGLASLGARSCAFGTAWAELNQSVFLLFFWFSTGMLMAVVHTRIDHSRGGPALYRFVERHPGVPWAVAGASYAAICLSPAFPYSFAPGYTRLSFTAEHVLYAWISFLLMLPAVFGEEGGGVPRRILSSRALILVGQISYGVFLWHEPIIVALASRGATGVLPGWPLLSLTLAALPPTLAVAWLSYRFVEHPLMQRRGKPEPR
jgi:peptidoglycan/LPS O-acetylase OafA/YrhL